MNNASTVRLDRINSPLGALNIVWSDAGLHVVDFADSHSTLMRTLDRLNLSPQSERLAGTHIGEAFEQYFSGDLDALSELPVAIAGTDFQLAVWHALREIPAGQTSGYGELAAHIGRSGAARAVGTANGSNPIPIVIPCHRVIAAGDRLGGYGGGLERKRWLLTHERAEFVDD